MFFRDHFLKRLWPLLWDGKSMLLFIP